MTTTKERLEHLKAYSDDVLIQHPALTRYQAIKIALELQKINHLDNIDDRLIDISASMDAICNEIPKIYEAIENIDLTN
jgi:hypothetical protein